MLAGAWKSVTGAISVLSSLNPYEFLPFMATTTKAFVYGESYPLHYPFLFDNVIPDAEHLLHPDTFLQAPESVVRIWNMQKKEFLGNGIYLSCANYIITTSDVVSETLEIPDLKAEIYNKQDKELQLYDVTFKTANLNIGYVLLEVESDVISRRNYKRWFIRLLRKFKQFFRKSYYFLRQFLVLHLNYGQHQPNYPFQELRPFAPLYFEPVFMLSTNTSNNKFNYVPINLGSINVFNPSRLIYYGKFHKGQVVPGSPIFSKRNYNLLGFHYTGKFKRSSRNLPEVEPKVDGDQNKCAGIRANDILLDLYLQNRDRRFKFINRCIFPHPRDYCKSLMDDMGDLMQNNSIRTFLGSWIQFVQWFRQAKNQPNVRAESQFCYKEFIGFIKTYIYNQLPPTKVRKYNKETAYFPEDEALVNKFFTNPAITLPPRMRDLPQPLIDALEDTSNIPTNVDQMKTPEVVRLGTNLLKKFAGYFTSSQTIDDISRTGNEEYDHTIP